MKKNLLILFLIFSSTLFAQDYEIHRSEASDYRDWSWDEMTEVLGESKALLPHYVCNGRDEFDPYLSPLRMNPAGDSLKIKNNTTNKLYTYQQGKYFDESGKEVSAFSDAFTKYVASALSRFEKLESASRMLRLLEKSYFPLTITLGNNSFNPKTPKGKNWSGILRAQAITFLKTLRLSNVQDSHPFNDVGVGGEIKWHPKLKVSTVEADGVKRDLDNDLALAHEMYHAFDSIRGLLDMGLIHGQGYEWQSVLEYRAVWFENQVRKELGLHYRKYYTDPGEGKRNTRGMLDDNGEPILIPSPCL